MLVASQFGKTLTSTVVRRAHCPSQPSPVGLLSASPKPTVSQEQPSQPEASSTAAAAGCHLGRVMRSKGQVGIRAHSSTSQCHSKDNQFW